MTGSQSSGFPCLDFDALYRGESPAEGMPAVTTPPWDTKAPKETVVGRQTEGLVHRDVLDIGCGLGENAVYLAQQGFKVTGLDISPTALITAERRAKDAAVSVTFAVADATKLEGYRDAFDTVIDSGMFHCLDEDGKRSYAAAVHRATRDGATLLMSCFCDANPPDPERPRPVVSELGARPQRVGVPPACGGVPPPACGGMLRDVLGGAGWDVVSLEPSTIRREMDGEVVEMAFWLVRAQRRA